MSGDYRISAQDGFAAYCRAYNALQRQLQESGMNRQQQEAWSVVVDASKAEGYRTDGKWLSKGHALTLIDMMSTPGVTDELRGVVTMPKEPTAEDLAALSKGWCAAFGGGPGGAYRALFDHLSRPPTRTEWHVTGYTASGALKSSTTVVTEAERDQAVRDAYRCGCERVEIVAREVAA